MTQDFAHILYRVEAGVAHLTLNRPERLNAMSVGARSTRSEIVEALSLAERDEAVGCVLISGAGRAFCAGGDLASAKPRETPHEELGFMAERSAFFAAVRNCRKPTVAAVHGFCLGAGMMLAAQCDLVVAAEDARFGLVEGPMGLPGATELVPRIGPTWAKYLIFTGDVVSAAEAKEMGLVFALVTPDALMARATSLAERIAKAPRASTELNKNAINSMLVAAGLEAALRAGRAHDALTAGMSHSARAPDGQLFRAILAEEGPPVCAGRSRSRI